MSKPDKLAKLKELASLLPPCLVSDWKNSNHYELTCQAYDRKTEHDYWWLSLGDYFTGFNDSPCDTEVGKRVGLLMDIAEEVARLRDEGEL